MRGDGTVSCSEEDGQWGAQAQSRSHSLGAGKPCTLTFHSEASRCGRLTCRMRMK